MSPTNEQIIAEANRRRKERGMDGLLLADFIIEVMRENWTPPKPVDPDLLAFREFASKAARSASLAESYRDGGMDSCTSAHLFLAGARMARERFAPREREMLAVLEEFSRDCDGYLDGDGHPWALLQRARAIIAKHKETAR